MKLDLNIGPLGPDGTIKLQAFVALARQGEQGIQGPQGEQGIQGPQGEQGPGIAPDDPRLSDAREWTAATVDQAEAEAGTATTRRAWTAQRVRQAVVVGKKETERYVQSRGQNLVTNGFGLLGDNTNFSVFTFDNVDVFVGGGSFARSGGGGASLNEFIPYTPGAVYELTFANRCDPLGGNAPRVYAGATAYDDDGLAIGRNHVQARAGSALTYLAAPLNPGDTTVTLASAAGWYAGGAPEPYMACLTVFGYVNSKGRVYPDYQYSRRSWTSLWGAGGISGNVITLSAPWAGPAFPAGRAVMNGNAGNSHSVYAVSGAIQTEQWSLLRGRVSGFSAATAFIRVEFSDQPYGTQAISKYAAVSLREIYPAAQISDSGATGQALVQAATPAAARLAAGVDNAAGARAHPVKTKATLPPAAASQWCTFVVADATGGPALCLSDGTNWINIRTGAPVT